MTSVASGTTRWGVRLRNAREIRRIIVMAALLILANAVTNYVFPRTLAADQALAHPDVYRWTAPVLVVIGGVVAILSISVADDALVRIYPLVVVVTFAAGYLVLFAFMWSAGYPMVALQAISYSILAIVAFYLLSRPAAVIVVVALVLGHAWLEIVSVTPWPAWLMTVYVAAVLLVAGSVTGWLMEQLERSRDAERAAAAELTDLNANLEAKVAEQVVEVERLRRLRRFLSAPVAEAVLTASDESPLAPHRREIAVLFCDLRGFTAFTRQVEPEEVMEVLDAYYAAAGAQITAFQATLGSFEGDGLMAYLNDPVPCDEPARRVVEMGLAIADAIDGLTPAWQRRGYDLSYGIGMALGHATLGIVGYDGRNDYTALGTVVNLAARLCTDARPGELLVDHRVFLQTEDYVRYVGREPVTLKGFAEPVATYLADRS